jgi:hypothetical protein
MDFTLGSDPEFMLVRNGKYHSAIGVVAGTKTSRIAHNGHEFYYDNVMAECAIKPGSSREEVLYNFQDCFRHYARLVRPYRLIPQASYTYPPTQLMHKDARDVGCKTEYCAYLLQEVKDENTVRLIKKSNFRSAGGHVHLGAKILQDSFVQAFTIRMLDLFLGLPLLLVDRDDTAPARRELYGKAGRHRRPAHGLEYRTPGNYWLSSPRLVSLVYDLCQFTLDFVEAGGHWKFWRVEEDGRSDYWNTHKCNYNVQELRTAIDRSNYKSALKFLDFIEGYLPVKLAQELWVARTSRQVDFYKEWSL